MPKRGNSRWTERKELVERFEKLFGYGCIDCLVADREFVGKDWTGWLNSMRIRYYIRIRQNFWVQNPRSAEKTRAWNLFNRVRLGEELFYHKPYLMNGEYVYLVGEHEDMHIKKIRVLKHGHRSKSIVKYGLEEIADVLNRPWQQPDFDIFNFLSCN